MPRMMSEMAVASAVVAPTANNHTSMVDAQVTQANFDTNMVIILAALLCALICALGLNSILRFALRCGYRFGMETPEQAAARVSATGLKKSALKKIPVAVYGVKGNKEADTGTDPTDTECPICLGEFMDGEKVRVLPKCNHRFHVSCIDTWFKSHSSCPNCRHSVLEAVGDTSSNAGGRESFDNSGGEPSRGGGDSRGQEEHVVVEVSGGS